MNNQKTILVTAYAVHPEKGSEDGTGWNIIKSLATKNKVIAITRENNAPAIEAALKDNPIDNLSFEYFDLPENMRRWKKKSRGAMLYYFLWQLGVALFAKKKNLNFDIAHALNFHCNWIPSFLWIFGKPFYWGPVGNHEKIPSQLFINFSKKEILKDRIRYLIKYVNWKFNPFIWICLRKAEKVFIVNSAALKFWSRYKKKLVLMPAVGINKAQVIKDFYNTKNNKSDKFQIISVGRFEALKGFDLTIESFAAFYKSLNTEQQKKTSLNLIGKGSYKSTLIQIAKENHVEDVVNFIEWLPQEELFEYYKNASLMLFPSHEGAGMVVVEAMAYGLPVVCLDNTGPGELIRSYGGIKVKPEKYSKTVQSLSASISKLHGNKTLLENLKFRTQEFTMDIYDWERKAELINYYYKQHQLIG